MFWIVINGKFRDVKKMHNSSHIKHNYISGQHCYSKCHDEERVTIVSHNLKFYVLIMESLSIDLCASFNEDGPSLPNVVFFISMNCQVDKK